LICQAELLRLHTGIANTEKYFTEIINELQINHELTDKYIKIIENLLKIESQKEETIYQSISSINDLLFSPHFTNEILNNLKTTAGNLYVKIAQLSMAKGQVDKAIQSYTHSKLYFSSVDPIHARIDAYLEHLNKKK
jgi:hypothetical protein